MGQRLQLQSLLEELLGSGNVYFQPPENIQMNFPCILYERDYRQTEYANNLPYINTKRYLITVIDRDPDSVIPDKVAALATASFDRHFVADNLNHDTFNLYY